MCHALSGGGGPLPRACALSLSLFVLVLRLSNETEIDYFFSSSMLSYSFMREGETISPIKLFLKRGVWQKKILTAVVNHAK
jgi:hypothetical protein